MTSAIGPVAAAEVPFRRFCAASDDGRSDEGLGRTKRAAEKVAASKLLARLSAEADG